jgi:hypothetical protein
MQCIELFGLYETRIFGVLVICEFQILPVKKSQVTGCWTIVFSVRNVILAHGATEVVWSYEQFSQIVEILLKYLISDNQVSLVYRISR